VAYKGKKISFKEGQAQLMAIPFKRGRGVFIFEKVGFPT